VQIAEGIKAHGIHGQHGTKAIDRKIGDSKMGAKRTVV
jgi:hypothetical protein